MRWHLRARTHRLAAPGGFFLRAETMHSYLSEIDSSPADLDLVQSWQGFLASPQRWLKHLLQPE